MSKELLKKVQLGLVSFAAAGVLAGCSTNDTTDDTMIEDPMTEESVEVVEPVEVESVEMESSMEIESVGMEESAENEEDIVAIAQGNPDFSILVSALQEADLVETLQGDGPFTVFAPTNAAFEQLLMDLDITAEELLAQPDLANVLTYHVVSGDIMAADLTDGMEAETVNGEELMFDLSGDPMVNDAMITTTDLEATNGVVHVIDKVLVPSDFELQEVEAN
ncbi:Cell surface lipoprotein MPT83 [Jeotgalibaca dankookensis]|uniref:Cell surface lipoprotein MPT83 n=1 Tax=Jeotgalibaca dankookensis TaxID=708126 RepID=A0A1S6IPY1_9LACT|nr:fasciclin domain-containing protein [Jeotgalibaca dankookensis]AQS53608.1 Cell surface lipoprotein MPT83 [Jeotgalibaca dankookensis]